MFPLSWQDVSAVCFDLDGTLVDSEGEAADAIALALSSLGRDLSAAERDFVVGHGFTEIYKFIYSHGGLALDVDAFEALVFKARVELFARNGAGMLPGAQQVVRWAAAKVPCALVTGSTRPEAELMLSALQVSSCFQVSFCAGEYASGKPSPEPYLRAATALACPPQRCIAVEDSVAGIASARAAGMTVIAVRAGNRYGQDQSAAHIAIDTLYDFESLFSPTR